MQQADSVDYVSRNYYDGCMLDRNRRLVESAGVLVAVYNGVQRSGAGATVRYARKMGREIIVIHPITRLVTHESPNRTMKQESGRIAPSPICRTENSLYNGKERGTKQCQQKNENTPPCPDIVTEFETNPLPIADENFLNL